MGEFQAQDPNIEYVLIPKDTLDAMIRHIESEPKECDHDWVSEENRHPRGGPVAYYEHNYEGCSKCGERRVASWDG